ncbi:hypothetical protein MMC17_009617 [Xylographa soralifera]|nr:hypothetical protein [Xylographa soralifera]
MAPILISYDQVEEIAKPVIQTQPKRRLRPIVPVVPRIFERKQGKSVLQTPASSVAIDGQDDHLVESVQSPAQPLPVRENQDVESLVAESNGYGSEPILDGLPATTDVQGQDVESPPTLAPSQFLCEQQNGFQLPPALYPTTPRFYPVPQPMYSLPIHHHASQSTVLSPYALNRPIIFQGEPDSNNSSPISLPSASSTTFTQPTPLSDTTSYRSQSIYQGYGHIPNTYQHYVPTRLVFETQEDAGMQRTYTSSTNGLEHLHVEPSTAYSAPPNQGTIRDPPDNGQSTFSILGSYLLGQFRNPSYADCILHLVFGSQEVTLMTHSLLIAQSPTLRALLESVLTFNTQGRKEISLTSNEPFLTIPAVLSGLQTYYGKSLSYEPGSTHDIHSALAFFSAGRLLQMARMQEIGLVSIFELLRLDNIELAFECALYKKADEAEAMKEETFSAKEADTQFSEHSAERKLMDTVIHFVVIMLPEAFIFDPSAPAFPRLGGFPQAKELERKLPPSNPELLSIRFGDFPTENHPKPSRENVILSRLLLSLPFAPLRNVLNSVPSLIIRQIVKPIIEERERRRLGILNDMTNKKEPANLTEQALERLSWEERVLDSGSHVDIVRVHSQHL